MEFDLADQLDLEWHSIFQKHLKNFSHQNESQTYTFDDILKKVFCPDPNDEHDIKYEDKEICEKCLLEALSLLSNRPTTPRETQIRFLLKIAKYTSRDESCFINLNASYVLQTLIYLSQHSVEIDTQLMFMEFLHSFLEHPSGAKWLMETKLCTKVFELTVNYQKIDARVSKIGYEILRILLEKIFEINSYREDILKLITGPLLKPAAQHIESTVLNVPYVIDILKGNATCLVEILEQLLKNYNADVLQYIMDIKVGLATDEISGKCQDTELCLILDRITIILSFFGFTEIFDGIKCIQTDPLELSGLTRIIHREIDRGFFCVLFELYYYALKYFKYVSDKLPKYSCKGKPMDMEDQLVVLQLEPILLEWARVDAATDITKVNTDADFVSMSHPLKIFRNLCSKTLCIGFKIKKKLPACSFDMCTKAVENIMRSKNLYSKRSLCDILDSLVYSLEAPLKYLQSKKNEEVTIEHEHQVFILALLEASLLFIGSFNLNWPDSVKILDLLYIVIEGSSSYQWIEPIMLDSLILLQEIISRRLSPSMALLIDNADGFKNIAPLLYKTCFTTEWKVRNAVLEVVHTIALSANKCFSSFKTLLFEASFPSLVSTMALNDESLRVRATALKCLQQLIVMEDIEEILSKNILTNKVIEIIMDNVDPLVMKEAIKLIAIIYNNEKYIDKDVMMKIYKCVEHATFSINEANVQKECVEFWRMVCRNFLSKEGWIDLKFPSVTFSKRIVPLTYKEVSKRYYKVLNELSQIGCLNVFKKFWKFTDIHEDAQNSLLESLNIFHYNFSTQKITPESMEFNPAFLDLASTQIDSLALSQDSDDVIQEVINDTMMKMMPNNLEFANNEDLFALLDTSHLNKNGPCTTAEVISEITQRVTPSEFVELVYKTYAEVPFKGDSSNEDFDRDVYVIDY